MNIICTDNSGFEDQLRNETTYKVLATGVNGYLIENDQNQERWYGAVHFTISGSSL
jgi:hypothetical protein